MSLLALVQYEYRARNTTTATNVQRILGYDHDVCVYFQIDIYYSPKPWLSLHKHTTEQQSTAGCSSVDRLALWILSSLFSSLYNDWLWVEREKERENTLGRVGQLLFYYCIHSWDILREQGSALYSVYKVQSCHTSPVYTPVLQYRWKTRSPVIHQRRYLCISASALSLLKPCRVFQGLQGLFKYLYY